MHAYRDGRAPGLERVHQLGRDAVIFPSTGTSEDIAMLLADDKGAELIVAVGTHGTLEEFLDKGRSGMASTFLTRLRVGSKLIDAKGVSMLYRSRISTSQLLLLALTALITMGVALALSPLGQTWLNGLQDVWNALHLLVGRTLLVIDFRYHLVSIVAIFLALAVGIVLGTTLLQDPAHQVGQGVDRAAHPPTSRSSAGRSTTLLSTRSRPTTRSSTTLTPKLVEGELAGEQVLLVEAPGVNASMREAEQEMLTRPAP